MTKRDVIYGMLFIGIISFLIYSHIKAKQKEEIQESLMKATTGIKVSELPVATSFIGTDKFLISKGILSRALPGSLITGAISDSATQLRTEVDSAKVNLRTEIGTGGGGISGTVGAGEIATGTADDTLTSDSDFRIDGDSLVADKHVAVHGDLYWKKTDGLSGNYGIIWNGSTQKIDTASLVAAAQAWRDHLGFWPIRYLMSRDSQALPLPNRAGVNLRRIDPGEGTYQIEYELETLNRGLWQLWCIVFCVMVVFGSVLAYLIRRKR